MANENKDVLRLIDILANLIANQRNKQFAFDTDNNRIVVKDAGGAFHYFSKDDDINPTDITITDNIVDAFRVREDTNDYFNVDTSDAQAIIYLGNAGTNPDVRILGSGDFSINESAPDSKVCVNIGTGTGKIHTLKTDTGHGFTGIAEADTIGYLKERANSFGGMEIAGLNAGSADGALALTGYFTTADATTAIVQIIGAESDGGTGAQAIGDADELLGIKNYTTEVVVVKGNGDIITQGGIELHQDVVLHSDGLVDLITGAIDWATADAAQDAVGGISRIDVGPTTNNNYYSLSGLTDGQLLWIYNTGSATAYVGAAGSGSENMAISADACGVCVYASTQGKLYAAT